MTDMPEEIWAWFFHRDSQSSHVKGGWLDDSDSGDTRYIRADVVEARIAEAVAKQAESVVAELARLRELKALVLEWQEARATYIDLCGDDNNVDIDIALRLSLATVSLEAWGEE